MTQDSSPADRRVAGNLAEVRIADDRLIWHDATPHNATLVDGHWIATWLPGRTLTREQARAAVRIAALTTLPVGDPLRELTSDLAEDLQISADEAIALATEPPPTTSPTAEQPHNGRPTKAAPVLPSLLDSAAASTEHPSAATVPAAGRARGGQSAMAAPVTSGVLDSAAVPTEGLPDAAGQACGGQSDVVARGASGAFDLAVVLIDAQRATAEAYDLPDVRLSGTAIQRALAERRAVVRMVLDLDRPGLTAEGVAYDTTRLRAEIAQMNVELVEAEQARQVAAAARAEKKAAVAVGEGRAEQAVPVVAPPVEDRPVPAGKPVAVRSGGREEGRAVVRLLPPPASSRSRAPRRMGRRRSEARPGWARRGDVGARGAA
ncbi:hypothetical protein GCM10027589_15540 [Actinocorallia lasiicapitis]